MMPMPRQLRSATSNTCAIIFRAATLPSRDTARAYCILHLGAALLQLPHRQQDAFQQIERLEAGDHDRHVVARGDRLVLAPAHHRADMPGPRNPCTRFTGDCRMPVIAGGTSTCDTSTRKVAQALRLRLQYRHRIGRRRGLEADREEHHLPIRVLAARSSGSPSASRRSYVSAGRPHLKQIAVRAGHAQHVAERAEDHVGAPRDGMRAVDHLQRRHAYRTPRPVHQFDFRGAAGSRGRTSRWNASGRRRLP